MEPSSDKLAAVFSCLFQNIAHQIEMIFLWIGIILDAAYNALRPRRSDPNVRLNGKTAIVTGANRGIGREAAKKLAARGAKVIVACRDRELGQKAVEDIRSETRNRNVFFMHLDLASFTSIRSFCEHFLRTQTRLDILVNNAGLVSPTEKKLTEDGNELCFQVNHLGPFLLTHLLLPLLKRSAPSRVVVVASDLAFLTTQVDFTNLNSEKIYSGFTNYSVTKWANVSFALTLARRLEGTGISVHALHPGSIKTDIVRDHHPLYMRIMSKITSMTLISIGLDQGSENMVYVATDSSLNGVNGKFFVNCKQYKPPKLCQDREMNQKMWDVSAKLTGIRA